MTKIDLITGFLGSGKTTFIRKYARFLLDQGLRVCILENDFGAVNIDTMLVSDLINENLDVEMVSGGCDSDCHKRRFKTKLIAMGMKKYDRVIVEPSGLYDVDEFFDVLYDEPLDSWYEIGSVITLADAFSKIPFEGSVSDCFMQELANSGAVIISKSEMVDSEQLNSVNKYIKEILNDNSNINIISKPLSQFDNSDFYTLMNSGYRRNDYLKYNIDDNGFSSLYFMDLNIVIEQLIQIVKELFENTKYGLVFRIKGFCPYESGYYEVNATSNGISINERCDGQNVFIVIGENLKKEEINKIIYQ